MSAPHILAKFPGRCPACGTRIEEGDDIYKPDDEWLCGDCYDEWGNVIG